MNAKLNNFLQSNIFILIVALSIGYLCHLFATTNILAQTENVELKYHLSHIGKMDFTNDLE